MSIQLLNNTGNESLSITLYCHHDSSERVFIASPSMSVEHFLEKCLDTLGQGEHAERMAEMRRCYQPILELVENANTIPLAGHHTLSEAGLRDGALCQIAAIPLKEEILFCRYARQK